jgi:hypothetical protein
MSPTGFPEEPITAGADFGPGPGPSYIPQVDPAPTISNTLRKIVEYTDDPKVFKLLSILEARGM